MPGRHGAEIDDGPGGELPAGRGKRLQLLHGAAPLLLLLRGEALECLGAVKGAGPLLRVHVVQAVQLIEFALLGLRIKLAKTGLFLQGASLVGRREILMVLHPLLEMPWALLNRGSRVEGRCRCSLGGGLGCPGLGPCLSACLGALRGAILSKAAGKRGGCGEQQNKYRAETKPG